MRLAGWRAILACHALTTSEKTDRSRGDVGSIEASVVHGSDDDQHLGLVGARALRSCCLRRRERVC